MERNKIKITKRWFTQESYEQIATYLGGMDWAEMDAMNCEDAAIHLNKVITEAMDIIAPVETKLVKPNVENQWTTQGIKTSLKTAAFLYKTSKRSKSLADRQKYKDYNNILTKVIRLSKNGHYENRLTGADNDTRKIWGILNEIVDRKQCKHKIPNRFFVNGKSVRHLKHVTNAFNTYFTSIGKEMADALPEVQGFEDHLGLINKHKMWLRPLEEEEVQEIMKHQQPKLSCGVDQINNKLVKTCHRELTIPMTKIINKSIEESYVPTIYKLAKIVPLYKKGAANECGNYRPVSLLSALSKILEKAICRQLMQHLYRCDLLCPDQFGFRPKSQTSHVVQKLLNEITANSIKNEVTIATFLDLSKAFDCLQYNKLFHKLRVLGLETGPLNWFKSYLSGRKQCVDIDGTKSGWLDVELGVPQGSILGPILFLIYVNDINNCDHDTQLTKFADDTTVITSAPTLVEATEKMNSALGKAKIWFAQNKLNLNPAKTRFMLFNSNNSQETQLVKIDDTYIERVWTKGKEKSFKLVGIHLDEKLKWDMHINYINQKMGYSNYMLSKAAKSLNKHNKKLLYSGLIHSHLVYGAPIWGTAHKCHLDKLLKQQKKSIRKIHNLGYRDHTSDSFVESNILKVPELMEYTMLSYIQSGLWEKSPKHVRNLWTIKENSAHILRDRGMKIETPFTKKDWISRLAPSFQAKLWNKTAQKFDWDIDPIYFKKQVKTHYLSKYIPPEKD